MLCDEKLTKNNLNFYLSGSKVIDYLNSIQSYRVQYIVTKTETSAPIIDHDQIIYTNQLKFLIFNYKPEIFMICAVT